MTDKLSVEDKATIYEKFAASKHMDKADKMAMDKAAMDKATMGNMGADNMGADKMGK
jgi:hypothetical protein